MDSKSLTMLNDLHVNNTDSTIKVRIIRRWTTPNWKTPNDIYSIELIVIDEKNNKLQCTVLKKFTNKIEKLFTENQCLYILNPSLAENHSTYKHVRYVIGYIVKRFDIQYSTLSTGKQSKRMNLEIEDLENKQVFVILWDSYCDQMQNFIEKNVDATNVVIIMQFGKAKWFKGEVYVSNSYTVARVYIDEDIDDIVSFKQSLVNKFDDVGSASQFSIGSSLVASTQDDFLDKSNFSSLSDISDIKEPKSVIVVETIKAIDKDIPWFYNGCSRCNWKVTSIVDLDVESDGVLPDNDRKVFHCTNEKCKNQVISAINRFKIPLRVQDPTGTVTHTMFDRDSIKLLGSTADELLKNNDEFDGEDIIPKRFNTLLERKIAFKIQVKEYNLRQNVEYYTISKLSEDESIISVLYQNFDFEQHTEEGSINFDTLDLPDEKEHSIKDFISSTGDNATPISSIDKFNNVTSSSSQLSNSSNDLLKGLKRNLDHFMLYGEDMCAQSSSKYKVKQEKDH
ncbi:hypothetical protein E3N88_18480 [Mikania micrantha]|uniref:Uncharacterized protein n=1 Tax=Mikania micrantha TaxID=192012 RepID=A0A5N6NKX7_9ASTR|nr:hypothetical protein E3N88_18480 [Mikania micrantha]